MEFGGLVKFDGYFSSPPYKSTLQNNGIWWFSEI
jgi:hypothetical protein